MTLKKKTNVTCNFRIIQHLKQKYKMFFIAQRQCLFLAQKYWNFSQITLRIQKILIFSNQKLNAGSIKTIHGVCAGCILQTYDSLNHNLFY